MAKRKVYGLCDDKCRAEVLSKSEAFGVASLQELIVESGTPSFDYDKPNYKMIYYNATKIEVYLPKGIVELAADQPNFNATIILHRQLEYGHANAETFNALLANIFKVKFAGTVYNVKFFAPSSLNPANCTTLHFYMFFDGANICCNVQGY